MSNEYKVYEDKMQKVRIYPAIYMRRQGKRDFSPS